jgi:uncharacterized membrane protein
MRVLVTLSLVAVVCAPIAQAASTPAQKCAVAKLKAATLKVNGELKCQKKALAAGGAVDTACLAKAQAKFAAAFAKAEAKGSCKNEGDAAEVQDSAELFVDDVVTTLGPPKSLAADVQPIFDANCTSCHSGSFAPKGMSLAPGVAFMDTVSIDSMEVPEVARVLPGDPDNSYLFWKITDNPSIIGESMPRNSPPMTPREIRMIRRWIEQGALDN